MSIETNALSLHEILLSISDSLNKAQNQLRNMPPFDEYGRPNTIYQLPYLDFNLEVISEFSAPTITSSKAAIPVTDPVGRSFTQLAQVPAVNYVRFVSFKETDLSSSSKEKIISNISGRFVAIMPNEGLQQVYVSCVATKLDTTKFQITVKLQYVTTEPVGGQRVEVNFDKQNSFNINGVNLDSDPVFRSLKDGFTDSNGEFTTVVELGSTDYFADRTFIFVANSGSLFSSVAISNI